MLDDGLKRPRLFEEVCGAGHNDELLCATELGERGAIERKHLAIAAIGHSCAASATSAAAAPVLAPK